MINDDEEEQDGRLWSRQRQRDGTTTTTRQLTITRSAIANGLLCGGSYAVLASWCRDLACHLQQEPQCESLLLTT